MQKNKNPHVFPSGMELAEEVQENRTPDYDVHPIFINRWSPRSMTGEPLTDEEIMPLFEAARWAPSSYNEQPWRFLYAKRETQHWDKFFSLLGEWNRQWCENAALLCLIVSKKTFTQGEKPNKVHSFDCGSAWENLALEGARRGLVVHGMAGFDDAAARDVLGIPDDFDVEAMFAVGKRAPAEDLPEEMREKERPSKRNPLSEILMEGHFRE